MVEFSKDFDSRYNGLKLRDPAAEGSFVYAVKSTGIVCRPTCSSRLALAKNVAFFDKVEEAVQAGFRPCRRCLPEVSTGWNKTRNQVGKACTIINSWASAGVKLNVDQLAAQVGLSKWHFCRVFKNYTDYTPRKFYLLSCQGLCPVRKLPAIRTKRFLARSKLRWALNDQLVEDILKYCEPNTTGLPNETTQLDLPELSVPDVGDPVLNLPIVEFPQFDIPGAEDLDFSGLDWCTILNSAPMSVEPQQDKGAPLLAENGPQLVSVISLGAQDSVC